MGLAGESGRKRAAAQTGYGAGRPKWGKRTAVQMGHGAGRPKWGRRPAVQMGHWGWRAKVGIDQEVAVHSKVFVVASKCVSGSDFWLSFILSEQIFPSNKTILKMNKRTSPNGRREEAIRFENERRFPELNQSAREARYNARGAKRRALEDLVSLK